MRTVHKLGKSSMFNNRKRFMLFSFRLISCQLESMLTESQELRIVIHKFIIEYLTCCFTYTFMNNGAIYIGFLFRLDAFVRFWS